MEDVTFARTWRVADGHRQIFALGVLDGHGGDATSQALRKVLPECIVYNLGDTIDLDDADRAREINAKIVLAFWNAQRQLDTYPQGRHRGSGSTATVCLWQGGGTMLWWAWVGDSEALTTLDHKPHASEREDRRVERTGASFILRAVNQTYVRLDRVHIAMTRVLGDTQSYEPFAAAAATDHQRHAAGYAVSPIPFVGSMDMGAMPDDASVIIASDGLWDVIDHRKAARIVRSDVGAAAKELVRRIVAKGTMDNVSVLVFMPKRLY